MKTNIKFISLIIFLCGCFSINAQDNSILPTLASENEKASNYVFKVSIDINSKITLTVQQTDKSEYIGNTSETKTLIDFLSDRNSNKQKVKPFVIVTANPNLNFDEVVAVIKKLRKSYGNRIKIEISESPKSYILIPKGSTKELIDNASMKPNPFTLVVKIDSSRKVFINGEESGSVYSLDPLETKLKEIFKEREKYKNFRKGTNEIEKTIFITASKSLQFGEVLKVAEVIEKSGASPIVLTLEEVDYGLIPSPPAPPIPTFNKQK